MACNNVFILWFIFVAIFIGTCQAQCPNTIQGVSYSNLPKLTNSGPKNGDWQLLTSGTTFTWNICAVQTSCPNNCGLEGTVTCQDCSLSRGVISSQTIQIIPGANSVNFFYDNGSDIDSNISVACLPNSETAALYHGYAPPGIEILFMSSPYACPDPVVPPTQQLAPTQLAAMTDMQTQWGRQLGWTGNASMACTWSGVQCAKVGIYMIVNSIDISANGLSGPIPKSISDLSSLVYFNCSQNPLIGGQIPSGLGNISSLQYLDMSYSGLTGTLPFNLQTRKLSTLAVTSNKLTGSLLTIICSIENYNFQGNRWDCPLPTCCGESGNYLCIPCVTN